MLGLCGKDVGEPTLVWYWQSFVGPAWERCWGANVSLALAIIRWASVGKMMGRQRWFGIGIIRWARVRKVLRSQCWFSIGNYSLGQRKDEVKKPTLVQYWQSFVGRTWG